MSSDISFSVCTGFAMWSHAIHGWFQAHRISTHATPVQGTVPYGLGNKRRLMCLVLVYDGNLSGVTGA